MRVVRTRVFPLPAPARISAHSRGRVTALSCSGLRRDRKSCIGEYRRTVDILRWQAAGSRNRFVENEFFLPPATCHLLFATCHLPPALYQRFGVSLTLGSETP